VNFLDIVFASLLANNLLVFHFFGLGEFLKAQSASDLIRRTFVLALVFVLAAAGYWAADHFLLQPFHVEFLRTLLLVAVLAVVLGTYSAILGGNAGKGAWPYPVELLVHSFLVGGVLLVGSSSPEPLEVMIAAAGAACGYGAALVLLGAVFRRLSREAIPPFVQGLPLRLLTLGLVWLVLHGLGFAFAGKVS